MHSRGGGGGDVPTGQRLWRCGNRVEKLRAIKTKYDPTNVFKAVENGLTGAHNIEPDRV